MGSMLKIIICLFIISLIFITSYLKKIFFKWWLFLFFILYNKY